MKEKLIQIKNSINRSNHSKYGFMLSVVALVEIIMIIAVSTFSWVETISSIKISNDGRPAAIDTYTFTDARVGVGSDYNKTIDLSNYFRASGNAHLSAASSADGVNFFFPRIASAGSSAKAYRKGTINDKNTNYISFSFKVTADSNQKFFFNNVPQFMANGDPIADKNDIRLAITVADSNGSAESTRIYSYEAGTEKVVADSDGGFVTDSTIRAFKNFTDNNSEDPDKMLFSVGKDETKIITVTLWLQDFKLINDRNAYSGKTISARDFKIVTATKMTQITFVDKTSGFNSTALPIKNTWQWVGNDNAKMWVRTAAGSNYEMKKSTASAGSAPMWTVSIPTEQMGDENNPMYFYRTESSVISNPQNNNLNFWETKFADNGNVNPVYSAYGSSINTAGKVYGTWGELSQIQVLGEDQNVLPTPSSAEALNITKVTMTNSNNISVEMNYNNGYWRAYIPKDSASKNLRFSFKTYNINASNRDITEDISAYYVTSSSTGYWHPPAVVKVAVYEPHNSRGSVSVSGGAVGAQQVKVTKGTTVTVNATPKADYAFEGWYTDPECTKRANQGDSSSFSFSADSIETPYTYYAKFQYNVRLTSVTDGVTSGDGGKVKINDGTAAAKVSASIKDDSKVILTAIPDTENYEFDGWYDKNNEQIKDDDGNHIKDTVITIDSLDKPIDYYAHFKVKYFILEAFATVDGKKDFKGGYVKFSNQSDNAYSNYATTNVKFTDKVAFMANPNSAEGYEFKGWYSEEACENLVSNDLSFEADKNSTYKTLYAKFELKKYDVRAVAVKGATTTASSEGGTVKITANGSSTSAGSDVTMKVTHGNNVTFEAVAKSSDGYKFIGWFDGSGNSISTSAKFTTANGISSPITYYARFTKGTTIYFTDSFAEEDSYEAYAAYVYQNDTGIDSAWPGKLISPNGTTKTDEATGYCVYINESDKSGDFNVIINDNKKNNAKQYPSGDKVTGLKGTFGNTYFFDKTKGPGDEMTAFDPISVGIDAATFNESGSRLSNGFTGGTIKVGFNTYDKAKTLSRQSGDTFYATPQPVDGYEFEGWYTNASCTTKVTSTAVTNNKLKIVPQDNATYYAKFVEKSTVRIYLKDSTSNSWLNEWTPLLKIEDKSTGEVYTFINTDDNNWYADVSADMNSCKLTRIKSDGTETWNTWDNLTRNGKNTLTVTSDSSASWS